MTSRLKLAERVLAAVPVGKTLPNPGRGTTTFVRVEGDRVTYRRGNWPNSESLTDLIAPLDGLWGTAVSTNDLRRIAPMTFDSDAKKKGHARSGHNCN